MDPFSAIEAGSVSLLRACDLFRSDVLGCVGFVKPKIFSTKIFLAPIFPSLVCGPLTRSPILLDLGWPSAAGLRPRLEISCSGICSCRNALPAVFPAGLLHPGALHSSGPHATGSPPPAQRASVSSSEERASHSFYSVQSGSPALQCQLR
jgi:hypothetical protein